MSTQEQARAAVRAIGQRAKRANLDRAKVLESALEAARHGTLDEDRRTSARIAAHQLAGSAGTFGYPRTSELSSRLGAFFRQGADPEQLPRATKWLRELHADLGSEPYDEDADGDES